MKSLFIALSLSCLLVACGGDDEPAVGADAAGPEPDAGRDAGKDAAAPEPDASGPSPDAGDATVDEEDSGEPGPEPDGGEPPPPDAGGVDSDYYPVAHGSRWVYRHTGGSTTWDEEVELTDTEHDGQPAYLLSDTPGPSGNRSESVLARIGSRVSRVYREEFHNDALNFTAEYTPGFIRFDHAWVERDPGYAEKVEYGRIERDAQGVLLADGDREHQYVVESVSASVSVPAGDFDDCLRVRRARVNETTGQPIATETDLFWFCAGIGKVREEDQTTLEAEELVSCDIPGGMCP
jgi:hypothetical protein